MNFDILLTKQRLWKIDCTNIEHTCTCMWNRLYNTKSKAVEKIYIIWSGLTFLCKKHPLLKFESYFFNLIFSNLHSCNPPPLPGPPWITRGVVSRWLRSSVMAIVGLGISRAAVVGRSASRGHQSPGSVDVVVMATLVKSAPGWFRDNLSTRINRARPSTAARRWSGVSDAGPTPSRRWSVSVAAGFAPSPPDHCPLLRVLPDRYNYLESFQLSLCCLFTHLLKERLQFPDQYLQIVTLSAIAGLILTKFSCKIINESDNTRESEVITWWR